METKRDLPVAGEFYRHFKGNLYQVIGLACDAGTMQPMVVYWALSGKQQWYVRSLAEFLSPVDREKYPDAVAFYRFERVRPEEAFGWRDASEEGQAAQEGQKQLDFLAEAAENADVGMREIKKEGNVSLQQSSPAISLPPLWGDTGHWGAETKEQGSTEWERGEGEHGTKGHEMEWDNPEAEKVRPELLRFLDAKTPAEKLSVLREIRGKLDEELMTSIELSIDLMPDDRETLERRLSLVEQNLEKRVRYEGGRLR